MSARRTIRVAAAQLPGLPLARAAEALGNIDEAVAEARRRGADVLILPECAYPAYALGSAAEYYAADILSGSRFVEHLADLARRHEMQIICGFVDDRGDQLRNTAVIIDRSGRECGRYCKSVLWGEDNDYFTPGDALQPIDTPLGRIGVVICADARAPETVAGLVAAGAELIAVPTCWVNVAREPGAYRNAQAEFMVTGRVLECGVPLAAANKFGVETDTLSYCGMSVILDAQARQLAQAPPDGPALIDAEVALQPPAPVEIPDWAQRRIFSTYPPIEPDTDLTETITLAVAPAALTCPLAEDEDGRDLFEQFAELGVHVVATSLDAADDADRLEMYGRSLGMAVIGYPYVERLMIERFGAFGCVASDHIYSFVPARAMALDGAAIIFVTGEEVPVPLLRTRAAENRVFLAAADHDSAILIDPNGAILDTATTAENRPIVAEIDLRLAADKYVFEKTHIWEQRRPRVYAPAFGVRPSPAPRE